ncbi:hypothetical protein [Nitrospina gracilis]|uniref:hypothetical protein n=1 Tax=Nitrospina gracilis TaxID=35801 RepID=UPI001F342131|nr:Ran GTPase-activating protein (RanGAP) involved in mRNA processing and transport [Nitrospina gracilis Nb-211]
MNQDYVLELFFAMKGDLNKINAAIDEKLRKNQTRKITTFETFIKSRISANPKVLRMVNMEITPDEAAYLSMYPDLEALEVLDLRQNHLGDEGLEAIVRSPVLKNLCELDLRSNGITRLGLTMMAGVQNLVHLKKVDFRSNQLGKRWETKLKESEFYPELQEVKTV